MQTHSNSLEDVRRYIVELAVSKFNVVSVVDAGISSLIFLSKKRNSPSSAGFSCNISSKFVSFQRDNSGMKTPVRRSISAFNSGVISV